jgi:patatin-like phospholipase/acyl hydrolase
MSDSNTLRVLSLDGGGMRGYISATFLKLFVQLWGINPNEIWKYFDIITGSSIGGLQALAYALGMSPTELQSFFTIDGPWIFTTSSSSPSVTPSTLTKINTIVGGPFSNPTFYPSTTAGIGTMRLKSKLDSVFGTNTLSDMKTKVLITSFEKNDANPDFSQNTNTPIYFSNSTIIPIFTGQNNLAVDVAMATSAAPLYFPAWNIGNDSYIDGGVIQNNPSSFSLAVAQAIKPTANRYCVLSIGTGLGDIGFPGPSNTLIQKAQAELI